MDFKCNYFPLIFTLKTKRSRYDETSTLLEKITRLHSILNQITKNFTIFFRYCQLGFSELEDCKDHMQSEHELPVLYQQYTSLSNPSSSTTQASDIGNFPASIEAHESAMKNTLMTFIILK